MIWLYRILWAAAVVNGLVWLFHDDHWGWGFVSLIVQPIAIVYGAGHLLGAW